MVEQVCAAELLVLKEVHCFAHDISQFRVKLGSDRVPVTACTTGWVRCGMFAFVRGRVHRQGAAKCFYERVVCDVDAKLVSRLNITSVAYVQAGRCPKTSSATSPCLRGRCPTTTSSRGSSSRWRMTGSTAPTTRRMGLSRLGPPHMCAHTHCVRARAWIVVQKTLCIPTAPAQK